MYSEGTTSGCAGWHERALSTPHPSPSTYTPTLSLLDFVVLRSTPVQPEGFTLAVFKPEASDVVDNDAVVVDALGRVLLLNPADYQSLSVLAKLIANDLPATGHFRNTWMVKQPTTSQPIERVLVRLGDEKEAENELKETSVQGYKVGKRELKEPVGKFTELPGVLYDFMGLVLEAREGYARSQESNMVRKVKDLVDAGRMI